ncbi:MAG: DmsC/YnfH family molybdoenzyme membrane anchor subunit [Acidimicrobiales bacterium]
MTILSAVAEVTETPIDRYLDLQAELTAVERFSQRAAAGTGPLQERYYRDLIPLNRPGPGQQYGFEVDLDSCTGCKACVAACHSLNGLDEGESWRSVNLLSGGTATAPVQQTVTSGCHHCVDPACLKGCPVDAYEKDPFTGIVTHLDDQCIGCSYCTLSCPYEVPVYNKSRGIVRKCDMCHGRLSEGEAPACVQACPNGAITIALVDLASATARAAEGRVVPGAPPSSITVPTTVYRTERLRVRHLDLSARPATRPAAAHTPLAVMLVLTQLAVGAFVADLALRLLLSPAVGGPMQAFDAVIAAAAGVLALGASVLHLGRPRYCYRAVIGLRHSWLSREVVAFGAFTTLAVPYALLLWLVRPSESGVLLVLGGVVAAWGVIGLACSVMIYATTHRSSWRAGTVAWKFALTSAACGLATVAWASSASSRPLGRPVLFVLAALMVAKLVGDAGLFRRQRVLLLSPGLRRVTLGRFSVGLVGGVAIPLALAGTHLLDRGTAWLGLTALTAALAGIVGGELLERSLFFTAASPPE